MTSGATGFIQKILDNPAAREVIALQQKLEATRLTTNYLEAVLSDELYEEADMAAVLLTALNGDRAFKEQTVEVEYLKRENKMAIPTGLGMNPVTPAAGIATAHPVMVERYWRVSKAPFSALADFVDKQNTADAIRKYVDTLSNTAGTARVTEWGGQTAVGIDPKTVSMVYGQISAALQCNFDIRDMGILNEPFMRVSDVAWKNLDNVDHTRLTSHLHAHSLMQIAALNTPRCKGCELGGWVRAYGISCGLLPDDNSATVIEYMWTTGRADREVLRKNTTFEKGCNRDIKGLCLNIISMFGLFHLAKDHTYRENDANMERIGTSWLNTLQLVCEQTMHTYILANREVICRTAAHPFGLAQTYFCAKLMNKCNGLSMSLALRVTSTPPPVQRIMICDAATRGWATLPAGSALNEVYKKHVALVVAGVAAVKENPPAYSGLFRLYGEPVQLKLPADVRAAADHLSPVVAGYAEAVYGADKNEGQAQGLALALSLANVKKEYAGVVQVWINMWNKYMDVMDRQGIMQFAAEVQYNTTAMDGGGLGGGV